jgi:hypothetical protein
VSGGWGAQEGAEPRGGGGALPAWWRGGQWQAGRRCCAVSAAPAGAANSHQTCVRLRPAGFAAAPRWPPRRQRAGWGPRCSSGCWARSTLGAAPSTQARSAPARLIPGCCSQQPAASSQQPAASSQQPAASSQQPAASSQQPAASSQQPAASTHSGAEPHSVVGSWVLHPAPSSQKQSDPALLGAAGAQDLAAQLPRCLPPPGRTRCAAVPAGRSLPPPARRPPGARAGAPGSPLCQSRPAPRRPRGAPCGEAAAR